MAVFQCKMCGGALEVAEGQNIAICGYCGSKQTIPKLGDDKVVKILERANTLRLNGEYDKALEEYDKILDENDVIDADIYWNRVLCTYGVVYVDDPGSGKKVPTVNRTQMTSVLLSEDYQKTIEFADPTTRTMYEEEARKIDDIQQGIIAVSRNEDPFDVFICYKETDDSGQRTRDSVAANEIYHYLTDEGYKVFFARITLEDKVGKYEPYIFAALNSAKIMIVLGSKKEYFEAPWVKNEWMRYINIMKKEPSSKRSMIPCYKDMDPYDLPKEFAYYQAQDMNKLGFIPDLIRGIKKIIPKNVQTQDMGQMQQGQAGVAPMPMQSPATPSVKKAKIFIEQRDYLNANKHLDSAFDLDPENWEIYLCKLLMDYNLGNESELKNLNNTFDNNYNYKKIVEYADEASLNRIKSYNEYIIERLSQENAELLYQNAESMTQFKSDNQKLYDASGLYKKIPEYKDSKEKAKKCIELIYSNILNVLDNSDDVNAISVAKNELNFIEEDMDVSQMRVEFDKKFKYAKAKAVKDSLFSSAQVIDESIRELNEIRDYPNVSNLIYDLQNKKIQLERNIKRAKRISFLTGFAAVFVVSFIIMISVTIGAFMSNGVRKVRSDDPNNRNRMLEVYMVNGKIQKSGTVNNIPIINGYIAKNMWLKREGSDDLYYVDDKFQNYRDGIYTIDAHEYAFDPNGVKLVNGFYKTQYFGEDGALVTNKLQEINGRMFYLDYEGKISNNAGKYTTNSDGALIGHQEIDGKEYYFDDYGAIKKNEWEQDSTGWVLYGQDGARVKNGAVEYEGNTYVFNDSGYLRVSQLIDISNDTYYAKADGKLAKGEVVNVDGKYLYFRTDGRLAIGETNVEGYRVNPADGSVVNENVGGVLYVGGKPVNGQYNGKWYSNGVLAKNTWAGDYYLGSDGTPLYNQWINQGGKKYYVGADGRYLRNTVQTINNEGWEFDASGAAKKVELSADRGSVQFLLSNASTYTKSGCSISYKTVKSANATVDNLKDITTDATFLVNEAIEEIVEYFEEIATDSKKPQEVKMGTIEAVSDSFTSKKGNVRIRFAVKTSSGKNRNYSISVRCNFETNQYEVNYPSDINLD